MSGGFVLSAVSLGGGLPATTPSTYSPVYSAASTSVAAGGGVSGVSTARMQQLLQGAMPATAAEQQWARQAEARLGNLVQALTAYAANQATGEDHSFEQRVIQLVNVQRAVNGLSLLRYDSRLDLASERHNAVQAQTRTMAHSGIGDGDPGSRIRATGFNASWGENVATGQRSAEQVVAEWMASPGHRRNILDPEFSRIGVAYGTDATGRSYWAQSFGA